MLASLAACGEYAPTAPAVPSAAAARLPLAAQRAAGKTPLLVCPAGRARSATAVIDERGGVLTLGGNAMVVPAGAVPRPTAFTIAVPASPYVRLDISAAGAEHYTFASPVSVVIDYTRCRGPLPPAGALSVWYVDPERNQPLADMGGVDDRSGRRLQFTTLHLSSYAIAY
jgi:hypothetical protein